MNASVRNPAGPLPAARHLLRAAVLAMAAFAAGAGSSAFGQSAAGAPPAYQVPPQPIARALEAPAPPLVLLAPSRDRIALLERPGLPSIAELAEPELGLAGATINPATNGPSRTSAYSGVTFRDLRSGESREAELPPGARLISPDWSPDGRHLAFLLLLDDRVELWTADAATGRAERRAAPVNAAFPRPFDWLPDSAGLIVRMVPAERGEPPRPERAPSAPIVRESAGAAAPAGTVQNLLSGPHDEALFEHYFTSRLALARLDGRRPRALGAPGLIVDAEVSPDGRYILQHRLKRPFSYSVSAAAFPTEVLVTDRRGSLVARIADRPAVDPAAVPAGRRAIRWRADAPATLFWAESGEGGAGDRLWLLEAPFRAEPRLIADIGQRFQEVLWGRDDLALVTAIAPAERAHYRIAVDPSGAGTPRVVQRMTFGERGEAGLLREWSEDRLHLLPGGSAALVGRSGGLARLDLASGELAPVWTEGPGERLFAPLDPAAERLLVWRESRAEPRNLFAVRRDGGDPVRITDFPDPAPEYAGMQSRRLYYRRGDGRRLSGTLHLPAGYDPGRDGPLPALVWAYPSSIISPASSPPLDGEPPSRREERFERPQGFDDLPLLLTARGFAVFEAAMPIVGTADSPPNDSHVPQLVANAEAAVNALVEAGVAEHGRIAIGGHSYGAAMAANLLAHSDLFRAGIALSGAYNRTLTPFGFQASERRSFWEAPEAYLAMSPFVHADRIDEPILLVHGAADSNSGTYPMQSERFYAALAATGGTARYVLLPAEGHQYRARESLMHLMWEMDRWLTIHLPGQASASGRSGPPAENGRPAPSRPSRRSSEP